MTRGYLAALFFVLAPTVLGGWLNLPGGGSTRSDADGNSVVVTPTLLSPVEAILRANVSVEQKVDACNKMCDAEGADCAERDCSEIVRADVARDVNSTTTTDDSTDDDSASCSMNGDGWCDNGNNNEECGYDGGDCCSCDCGVNATTSFTCGVVGYSCIDPNSACVDDDDDSSSWSSWGDDDGPFSECSDAAVSCVLDDECQACMESATSSTSSSTGDDDDIADTCPIYAFTCSSFADFYCCALEEVMDEGCADNPRVVEVNGCIHDVLYDSACDFDSFCDYEESDDECSDVTSDCINDEECMRCLESAFGGDDDDDEVVDMCGYQDDDDSCSETADFYCCAIETDMDDGCEDNRELVALLDCVHEYESGDDCGFGYSFCDYSGASNILAEPAFAAVGGAAVVAGLAAVTTVIF